MKFFNRERATVKKAPQTQEPQAPVKSDLELAAERESSRGARIASLAGEAKMWREFAIGCKPGRYVIEHYSYYTGMLGSELDDRLSTRMDEITCESWKAFAQSMAGIAERRLREILGA